MELWFGIIQNHRIKDEEFSEGQLEEYLNKINTETLLAYGVYQVEADGIDLLEYIKGDHNSIMGLPIKEIISYIKEYKKNDKKIWNYWKSN